MGRMRSTRKMRGGMPARWGPASLRTPSLRPMSCSRASPLPKSKKRKERRALERPSGPSHGPRHSEIGTKPGKRRRLGDEPLHVARLSRAYSEGGYHVYMTAELNSKLDAQLKEDLKDVEGDLGTLPGIAALKDGGVFTKHIGTSINISRPGKLGKIAGLTLASVGSALLNMVQTKEKERSTTGVRLCWGEQGPGLLLLLQWLLLLPMVAAASFSLISAAATSWKECLMILWRNTQLFLCMILQPEKKPRMRKKSTTSLQNGIRVNYSPASLRRVSVERCTERPSLITGTLHLAGTR